MSKVTHSLNQLKHMLEKLQVTPAVLTEELMKGEDVDVLLTGLVNFLEQKEIEGNGMNDVIDEKLKSHSRDQRR
jgi:hypothetical protein